MSIKATYNKETLLREFIPPDETQCFHTHCSVRLKDEDVKKGTLGFFGRTKYPPTADNNDKINPSYYKTACGLDLEAIDFIKSILTKDQFIGYCAGNALKYRLRAGKKSENIDIDIKKAMWYEEKIKDVK